jgi:hypothetical protein
MYHNRVSHPKLLHAHFHRRNFGGEQGEGKCPPTFFVPNKNLIIFCVEEGQVKNKWQGEWGKVLYVY